ncbi:putative DNA primase/helicase [Fluviicoccus keumensis]|uniref:Putative DNA primase/helicase n=1 Tax=Fluviicoccus keumensis TaxID=1435465 RepID=A0A4Q7ZAB5_9GAMM|nr:DUF927 domain-containing protein [Fluviicoccus keumensis]RZU46823.1 putative DNA primase/helicase [Fluviicoccus keumensis]
MTTTNTGLIQSALAFIPAHDRETWLRVGMALKSELGEEGFPLWNDWSANADSYKPGDAKDVWRSVNGSGGVGIATLFHLAKENGYRADLPRPEARPRPPEAPAADRKDKAARQMKAADKAQALWQAAPPCADHPYLTLKGVQGYGVKCFQGELTIGGQNCRGCLLVPIQDGAGKLHSLQFLADDGQKRFLPGGAKQGHFFLIPGGESQPLGDMSRLLMCEGYATGASLHEATGRPVAVAFDSGNLLAVAQGLRQTHPAAALVICADNDTRTPGNPGLRKAQEAARAVNGLLAVPVFADPQSGTDFNDLHRAAGIEAVKAALEQAAAPDAPAAANDSQTAPYFYLDEHNPEPTRRGVWHVGLDKEGNPKAPQHICGVLKVLALTRNADHMGHGYLLEWLDRDNHRHQWAMPAELFKGDGSDVRGYLMSGGLFIAPSLSARNLLSQYIQTQQTPGRVLCVERTGWQDNREKRLVFVTPERTYGPQAASVVYQSDSHMPHGYKSKADLDAWRDRIAACCSGNSRLVFGVSCAFAGALLKLAGDESGGFHFRGNSSLGKSTAQHVACSVWGSREFKQSWRSTINGLEATAAMYNDGLLVLDEIAQAEPRDVGETVYMLANGQGKNRASKSVLPRKLLTWRLLFLSSGEVSLNQHMQAAGRKIRAGQELRLVDIPADTESGHGLVETLHGFASSKDLVEALNQRTGEHYGSAGKAFLEAITRNPEELAREVNERRKRCVEALAPADAGGQVLRVATRFALVAVAGELATEYGITGWPKGEAWRGVKACFDAWLSQRGTVGNLERELLLQQVKAFLEQHGESRFSDLTLDHHTTKTTINRMGYREPDDEGMIYFVLGEAFKEVISGYDKDFVVGVLKDAGWLRTGEGKHVQVRKRLPEGNVRVYCLMGKHIFDD